MPTDIERLRGLLAEGTARPWRAEPSCDEDENVYWSEDLNAPVWLVATPLTNDTATWLIDHIRESDATLIAETINALPSLLDEVERLRVDACRYAWLRDGNAYAPEESYVRGGIDLDNLCDSEIAALA